MIRRFVFGAFVILLLVAQGTFPGNGVLESTAASSAALASASINNNVGFMRVASVVAGQGCPLTYLKGGASPTSQYGSVLNTVSNTYWEPLFDSSPVRACQFGTVADGVMNQTTLAITGTNNAPTIQNAIDYALRNSFQTICLSDGAYRHDDTLAMGWGQALNTLALQPCNRGRGPYAFVPGLPGVTLLPTKTDRCAINITGARQSSIRGIQILGQNINYINSTVIPTLPWPTTALGWLAPALNTNPGGLSQHTPYAAVCVDAFISTAPSPAYPAQTFPAWTGIVSQYGQDPSSDIVISDMVIQGFAVGIVVQPNGDANGDFNKIQNIACTFEVYCVALGNSQNRATVIENLSASNDYTLLTNTKFGSLNGEFGGHITNYSCSQCFQIFDITTNNAGLTIQDGYQEAGVMIGNLSGSDSVTFNNCTFNFESSFSGVVPPALIEATNGSTFKFNDCAIGNTSRIETLVHVPSGSSVVTWNGGRINGAIGVGALFGSTGAGGQNAVNYTGGIFMGATTYPNTTFPARLIWEGQAFASTMSTPTGGATLSTTSWTRYPVGAGGSRVLWSQAMQGFIDSAESKYWTFSRGPGTTIVDQTSPTFWPTTGGGTGLASSGCDTWAGQWSASQQGGQNGNLSVGDFFYHQTTGTIWVVESVGSASPTHFPISLRQHNNVKTNSSSVCTVNNFGTTVPSGQWLLIHVNLAIPGQVFYCDFQATSVNLTNCDRGDGNGTQMSSNLVAGDKLWAGPFNDPALQWPYASNTTLATVTNGSPGSIVLSVGASKTGRYPILPLPSDIELPASAQRGALTTAPVFTIGTLPACAAAQAGAKAAVTNGVATPALGAAVSTTGAAFSPVTCSGAGGWVYG